MAENPEKPKYDEEKEKKAVAKAKAKKDPRDADPDTLRKEGFTSEEVDLMTKSLSFKKTPREFGVLKHNQDTGAGIIGDVRRELPQKETLSREQLIAIAKKFGMTDQSISELTGETGEKDEWVETVLKPYMVDHELKNRPKFLQNNRDLEHRVKEIENNIIQQARTLGIPHETIFHSNTFDLYDEIKARLELISKAREESPYAPGVVSGTPLEEKSAEIPATTRSEEERKKIWDEVLGHYQVLHGLLHKAYFRTGEAGLPDDKKIFLEHYQAIKDYYDNPENRGDKNFINNRKNFEAADYLGKFYEKYQKQPTKAPSSDFRQEPKGDVVGAFKVRTGPAEGKPEFQITAPPRNGGEGKHQENDRSNGNDRPGPHARRRKRKDRGEVISRGQFDNGEDSKTDREKKKRERQLEILKRDRSRQVPDVDFGAGRRATEQARRPKGWYREQFCILEDSTQKLGHAATPDAIEAIKQRFEQIYDEFVEFHNLRIQGLEEAGESADNLRSNLERLSEKRTIFMNVLARQLKILERKPRIQEQRPTTLGDDLRSLDETRQKEAIRVLIERGKKFIDSNPKAKEKTPGEKYELVKTTVQKFILSLLGNK